MRARGWAIKCFHFYFMAVLFLPGRNNSQPNRNRNAIPASRPRKSHYFLRGSSWQIPQPFSPCRECAPEIYPRQLYEKLKFRKQKLNIRVICAIRG